MEGSGPLIRRPETSPRARRAAKAALLLALLAGEAAAACRSVLDAAAEGTVRLGVNADARPFSYLENGGATGYSVALCRAALAEAEVAAGVRHAVVTPRDQFARLRAGEVDLLCTPLTHTLARREREGAAFSTTVFVTGADILSRTREPVAGIEEFRGRRVSVVRETTTEASLAAALSAAGIDPAATLAPVGAHAEGVARLRRREVDAHVGDQALLLRFAQDPRLSLAGELNSFEPYAIALRACDRAGRDAVDRGLARLFRSGRVWPIYREFFPGSEPGALLIATYILGGLPE